MGGIPGNMDAYPGMGNLNHVYRPSSLRIRSLRPRS